MVLSDWIDTVAVPPRRLPDQVDEAIAYLSTALGVPVYQVWTAAALLRRYGSMTAARDAQPGIFQLLVDAPEVVQFWHLGNVVALPRDNAPERAQTVERLLRALSSRFRPVSATRTADHGPVRDATRRQVTPARAFESDRQWLSRTGKFFNADSTTNTLSARDDSTALVAFMADRANASPHTRSAYATDLKRLIAWCRSQAIGPLSGLGREDLIMYREALPGITSHTTVGTLSPASCARALAVVKSLYQFWTLTGYLRVNPAVELGDASHGRRASEPKRFLADSATQACDHWIAGWLDGELRGRQRDRRTLVLALYRYTGARLTELASVNGFPHLLVDGVDWSLEVMGKGQCTRRIPLPAQCIRCIRKYREARGLPPVPSSIEDTPLIHAKRGQGLGRSGLYREVKAAFAEIAEALPQTDLAGRLAFQVASTHWLRHSYVHQLVVRHQVPLPAAQALAGHASVQTTAAYALTDQSQLRKFVQKSFDDGSARVTTPLS